MKGLAGFIEAVATQSVVTFARRRMPSIARSSDGTGFLVGHDLDSFKGDIGLPVELSREDRRKHLYVLGATGSGKTNLLLRLIDDEMKAKRAAIIIDLRGDLVDRILARLASSGQLPKLCFIDLREDEHIASFNPLSGSGETYARALHLLDVIRHIAESWGVQLEETLRNCLLLLAAGGYSLLDIEALLEDESFRSEALRRCTDPHIASFFERYNRLSPERQQAFSLPVLNKVTPLLCVPQIRQMLEGRGGIDFKTLMDEPGQVVLIALAAHRFYGASHLLGGLIVSAVQSAAMARASIPEESRNPVTLFIDEFETMASKNFAEIIAEGRRFGLSLVLSHQNLSQLGGSLRQVIRNNVATQLFFQTGSSDAGELAQDVTGLGHKETVKELLLSQGVGQAILVRKGRPSLRVITPESPDQCPNPANVTRLRLSALEAACSIANAPAPKTKKTSAPSRGKEIRHEKLPKTRKTK